jgi:hypothetical protein
MHVPVEDQDPFHLDLLPVDVALERLTRPLTIDGPKPLGGDGGIVEEAEAHRFFRFGMVSRRTDVEATRQQDFARFSREAPKKVTRGDMTYRTIANPFRIWPSATALAISITPPHDKRAQNAESGLTYSDKRSKNSLHVSRYSIVWTALVASAGRMDSVSLVCWIRGKARRREETRTARRADAFPVPFGMHEHDFFFERFSHLDANHPRRQPAICAPSMFWNGISCCNPAGKSGASDSVLFETH